MADLKDMMAKAKGADSLDTPTAKPSTKKAAPKRRSKTAKKPRPENSGRTVEANPEEAMTANQRLRLARGMRSQTPAEKRAANRERQRRRREQITTVSVALTPEEKGEVLDAAEANDRTVNEEVRARVLGEDRAQMEPR